MRPTTRKSGTFASAVVISSVMPSEKNSCSEFNYSNGGYNYVYKYKRDTYACDEIEKSNVKCAIRMN